VDALLPIYALPGGGPPDPRPGLEGGGREGERGGGGALQEGGEGQQQRDVEAGDGRGRHGSGVPSWPAGHGQNWRSTSPEQEPSHYKVREQQKNRLANILLHRDVPELGLKGYHHEHNKIRPTLAWASMIYCYANEYGDKKKHSIGPFLVGQSQ
jgi:hypothetical protein